MKFVKNLALLLLLFAQVSRGDEKSVQLITSGGGEIFLDKSVPGVLEVKGGAAFPILKGANKKNTIIAAGASGKGRVVAFTHGSFLKPGAVLEQKSATDLVANCLRWSAKSSKPLVGLHPALASLEEVLKTAGLESKVVAPSDLKSSMVKSYCVIGHQADLTDAEVKAIRAFVTEKGGGLLVASTPWAFKKKYSEFSQLPGNIMMAGSGVQFLADGYADKSIPLAVSGLLPKSVEPNAPKGKIGMPSGAKSNSATEAARKLAEKGSKLASAEKATLIRDLEKAKDLADKDLDSFLPALKQLNESVGAVIPTKEEPIVPGADPLVDAIVDLETHFNLTLPAGLMYPIPAAENYPGEVPADAERKTHQLKINGVYKGWLQGRLAGGWAAKEMRPTGVYAAPGEIIKVTVPARLAGEGFEVVIGSYNGGLKNRDKWTRYPKLLRAEKIESRETSVSNALGGLITIRVPKEADYEEIEVTIEGGIDAPLYVHGKTDVNEWKSTIRKYPAPWAEIASERMIIAIPSDHIRNLNNPDELMDVWNGIIDSAAVLVGVDRNDYRAERIVFDRLTAAGSMHSSYPVAAHIGGSSEMAVDAKTLKKEGNWGFFHEYGHNHQHNLWGLPGTGETTCNLWSVYVYEEFIGKNRDNTHRAIRPLDRKQRMNAYFDGGRNFTSEWSTWVALEAYLQIQEEFGWEPFTNTFVEYNNLPKDEWPSGQQEINDQWVIRLSKHCGKNLAPFWKAWNLPMTSDVDRALKDLPVWEDHPVKKYIE